VATSSRTSLDSLDVVPVAPIVGRARPMVASPLDGRYGAMDPGRLAPLVDRLLAMTPVGDVDLVLGIPEGGIIPAYAYAAAAGLPLALASIWRPDLPGVLTFQEEHDGALAPKHIFGIPPGSRVLIVEDEVTTGRTVINCVRALRDAGIECHRVATLLSIGDGMLMARLGAEGIQLDVAHTIDPGARRVAIG